MVTRTIDWYKKYRAILNAAIIQLRRADGRDLYGWMQVDPTLPQKGLVMLFNPTDQPITRTIALPLYYTGKTKQAYVIDAKGVSTRYHLSRGHTILFTYSLPANGYNWFLIG
jgi:hypothetical protein